MFDSDRHPPDLEAKDLWFAYDDDPDVLAGVSLRVNRGDFVALIGQNGSGKTTLAKHFLGLLRPRGGRVLVGGEAIRGKSVASIARSVGYVFQNPDHQIFSETVRDEISFGPRNLDLYAELVEQRTEAAIERFGLAPYADRQPATLSWGLRRKVALASVYAMDPQVLILDEPTGGLDRRSANETMALLRELNGQGKSIVLITHDMRLVAEHARRTVLLRHGQVLADEPTRKLMEQEQLLEQSQITAPQVWQLARDLGFQRPPLDVAGFCREFGEQLEAARVRDVGRA